MKEYLKSIKEVLEEVKTNENGLTSSDAEKRLEENGKNKLKEPKKDGVIKKFIKSLMDPMIIMLLGAAIISAITSVASGDNFADVFIILFVKKNPSNGLTQNKVLE